MEEWRDADHEEEARRPVRTARPVRQRTQRPTASPDDAPIGAGPLPPPAGANYQTRTPPALRQAFTSRQALRQAILLHEILGLPKALQRPSSGSAHPPDGQAAS